MSDIDDDLIDNDDSGDSGDGDDADSGSSTQPKDPKSDKRIADLQSKADKETARANKAEAALKRFMEAAKEPEPEGSKPKPAGGSDAVPDAILDMARMFAVQQNPKLAEYGLSSSDLTGSTPSEIAQNAADLVARYSKIETQARNKALAENGLAPEITDGAPSKPKRDFSTMSKEDFDKVLEKALRGEKV